MPTTRYGPFGVVGGEVSTGVTVQAGDTVRTVSEGLVDFGGAVIGFGAPILSADGDSWSTPPNYPAPSLRKNSLICRVGSRWYQGGVDKSFTPGEGGEVILRTNDNDVNDNSRGWTVTLYVTPAGEPASQQSGQQAGQQAQAGSYAGVTGGACGGCSYYFIPPWWVTLPPWWITMGTRLPTNVPSNQLPPLT
jgi:hypothetical protein